MQASANKRKRKRTELILCRHDSIPAAQQNAWQGVLQATQNAVTEAARKDKSIRKWQQRLMDDILVLILALRPSVLIDYARIKQQTLQWILQQLDPAILAFDPGRLLAILSGHLHLY